MADELTNAVYDEEEAKDWSLNISDKIRQAIHGMLLFIVVGALWFRHWCAMVHFLPYPVCFDRRTYRNHLSPFCALTSSLLLSPPPSPTTNTTHPQHPTPEHLSKSRYKIVVQTTLGQMKDQGIRVASRCLWDPSTDNYASAQFTNATIFCSVLVFALYMD